MRVEQRNRQKHLTGDVSEMPAAVEANQHPADKASTLTV
jgi:hypothetical protein